MFLNEVCLFHFEEFASKNDSPQKYLSSIDWMSKNVRQVLRNSDSFNV